MPTLSVGVCLQSVKLCKFSAAAVHAAVCEGTVVRVQLSLVVCCDMSCSKSSWVCRS
jgi:hypothetical protein